MKKTAACIVLFLLVVVGGIYLYSNSFSNVLRSTHFAPGSTDILDCGIDNNNREYRVVMQYNADGPPQVARFTKNRLGIWEVKEVIAPEEEETDYAEMQWRNTASIVRFSYEEETTWEEELHAVCIGYDAVKKIEISDEMLLPNTTVNVHQAGNAYVLHLVSYKRNNESWEEWNTFSIYEELRKAGFIRG